MAGVKVNFSANDAGFTSTVSKVNQSMKGMDDNVSKVSGSVKTSFATMAKAGAALAVGFGAIKAAASALSGTIGNFKEALDMGGELSDLAARTGETAGNLLVLQRAFQNSGAGAEKAGPAINKLQRSIVEAGQGVTTYVRAFETLGLNLEDLKYKSPTDQLQAVAEALADIENPTERSAAAMQLLGRSGGELLPFLLDFQGEVANAREELGSLPDVMDTSAAAFDKISDRLNVMKGKLTEFAAGVLQGAIPAMDRFTNAGAKLDAAGFGQDIGMRLAEAFEMITSGDMWELFRLNAQKAISRITTSDAMAGLSAFVNTIWDGITAKTSDNFDFDRTFQKYAEAAIDSNNEVADHLQKQIDSVLERQATRAAEIAKRVEESAAQAAAESAIMLRDIDFKPKYEPPAWIAEVAKMQQEVTTKPLRESVTIKQNFKEAGRALADSSQKVLAASEKLKEELVKAQAEQPLNRQVGQVRQAIEKGDFRRAEREIAKLQAKEAEMRVQERFGDPESKIAKSIKDIAKEQGVDTFRKTTKQLLAELDKLAKEPKKEGKPGDADEMKKKKEPIKEPDKDQLPKMVQGIKMILERLERKLPTPALS